MKLPSPSAPRLRRRPGVSAWLASLVLFAPAAASADGQGVYGPVPLKKKDALLVEKSAEMAELFQRWGHVITEGPEVELVQRVGRAVAPRSPVDGYQNFRFAVVRSPIPNAFALPDGQVYVHSGLLALLENEAQLASVLAHECMHVEGHHSIIHARQARKKAGGAAALSILVPNLYGLNLGSLVTSAFRRTIIGHGRDLEEEADRRGLVRMLEAGYDPREMPRTFELLDEDPEGERLPVKPAWSDHPMNVARAAYTREMLEELAPRIEEEEARRGALRVAEDGFQEIVAASARQSIRQWLDMDRPRTARVLAERMLDRWPEDADVHALLGDAYRILDARTAVPTESELSRDAKKRTHLARAKMTRQERERARREAPGAADLLETNWRLAEEAYLDALERAPGHPEAMRGMGLLLDQQELHAEAGRYLARYLRASPGALDHEMIVRRLADITKRLRAEDGS